MKMIKFEYPSGTELHLNEEDYLKFQEKVKEANGKLTATMIDGNLHLVPAKAEPK